MGTAKEAKRGRMMQEHIRGNRKIGLLVPDRF
jgi:hypothetical protein